MTTLSAPAAPHPPTPDSPYRPTPRWRAWARLPALAWAAALVVVARGLWVAWSAPVNSDMAWLVYMARQSRHGAVLYRDLLEINPPLAVWLWRPALALTERCHLAPAVAFHATVVAILAASVALAAALWHRVAPRHRLTPWLALLLAAALATLPGPMYGQREHLIFALLLPCAALALARLRGQAVPPVLAALAGVGAALAVGLKPHYALVPVLWLALTVARRRRPGIELPVCLAVGLVYLAAVALATPDYLTYVRAMAPAYAAWRWLPVEALVFHNPATALPPILLGILAVGVMARWGAREPDARDTLTVLCLYLAGAFGAAVLQHKGFRYHFLTAMQAGFVVLGLLPALRWRPGHTTILPRAAAGLLVLLGGRVYLGPILGPVFVSPGPIAPTNSRAQVAALLRTAEPGTTVAVLSPWLWDAWPAVLNGRTAWALRMPSQWGLAVPEVGATAGFATAFRHATVRDLERTRPALVLVYQPLPAGSPVAAVVPEAARDLLATFDAEPRFRALLAHYRRAPAVAGYAVFIRRDP